jgi:hypothetical protein
MLMLTFLARFFARCSMPASEFAFDFESLLHAVHVLKVVIFNF